MPRNPDKHNRKRLGRVTKPPGTDSAKIDLPKSPGVQEAINLAMNFDRARLLAIVLKIVMSDRITDEEIHKVCGIYYDLVDTIWEQVDNWEAIRRG
jgi:hypothetical protein